MCSCTRTLHFVSKVYFWYILISPLFGFVMGGHAIHASSYQIQQLWRNERKIVKQMRSVSKSLEEITVVFKRYLDSWEAIADDNGDLEIQGDPAATYALLRHVSEGWKEVDDILNNTKKISKHLAFLSSRPDRETLPNGDDVTLASEALAKLAHFYRFNSTSLSRGFIQGMADNGVEERELGSQPSSQPHPLSVNDLASIGVIAMNKGYLDIGVEFLTAAKTKATSSALPQETSGYEATLLSSDSDFSLQRVESLLNTAVKVHNHVLDIRGPRSLTHTAASYPYKSMGHDNQRKAHLKGPSEEEAVVLNEDYLSRHDNKSWMLNHRLMVEQQQIERLCRGEDLREMHVRSSLSCTYLGGRDPWLLLGPFKVEVVSLNPHIAMVYDIISPKESKAVKKAAHQNLQTPHNQLADNKEASSSAEWSLKHVWLKDTSILPLQNLRHRLSHITNVHIDDDVSEPFMVANYGLGGEYKSHRDTHGPTRSPPDENVGERLATTVTYLEAPRAGGRLVFPWVGVGVKGVDRAAIIWWNLLASHEYDFLTVHAACPILRGHKWIANKWVGYKAQWNTQPCPLDPSKKIDIKTG